MMVQRELPLDISARKHRGNAESVAAFARAAPSIPAQRAAVLALVRESLAGITSKEIAARLGVPLHCISGRLAELKAAGLVRPRFGDDGKTLRRQGAAVIITAS